jgi:hypothetical protein
VNSAEARHENQPSSCVARRHEIAAQQQAVNVEAFVNDNRGQAAKAAPPDGERQHFQIAGDDNVRIGKHGAQAADQRGFAHDRQNALRKSFIVGAAQIDGGASGNFRDRFGRPAEAGDRDRGAARPQHDGAAMHGRVR